MQRLKISIVTGDKGPANFIIIILIIILTKSVRLIISHLTVGSILTVGDPSSVASGSFFPSSSSSTSSSSYYSSLPQTNSGAII